jgi:hypothetical protein
MLCTLSLDRYLRYKGILLNDYSFTECPDQYDGCKRMISKNENGRMSLLDIYPNLLDLSEIKIEYEYLADVFTKS